ncbi:TetR/AcrR family transcriptional regulator [Streptomyces sp. NPDC059071]|uniref:TetR/AcrR family transcriptional regulator n=1 Tax=unclassified Streptomyces TaxID=2593676 RepID=UPI003646140F
MTSVRGAEEDLVLPGARTGREPERSLRPGPRRLSPEQVASRQRDRLLDGVARTVAANGYTGARISDICRAAGVTRPVFYELFSGKEDAVLAAFRGGTETVVRAMQRAYEERGGAMAWPAAVRSGLEVLLTLLAQNPAFATMVVEIESVGPAGRRARSELLASFRRFFADAPPGPPEVARAELVDAVVGAVHAAVLRAVDEGRFTGTAGTTVSVGTTGTSGKAGTAGTTGKAGTTGAAGASGTPKAPRTPGTIEAVGAAEADGGLRGLLDVLVHVVVSPFDCPTDPKQPDGEAGEDGEAEEDSEAGEDSGRAPGRAGGGTAERHSGAPLDS